MNFSFAKFEQRTFWSDGYFLCSIGEASLETTRQYILTQGRCVAYIPQIFSL